MILSRERSGGRRTSRVWSQRLSCRISCYATSRWKLADVMMVSWRLSHGEPVVCCINLLNIESLQ